MRKNSSFQPHQGNSTRTILFLFLVIGSLALFLGFVVQRFWVSESSAEAASRESSEESGNSFVAQPINEIQPLATDQEETETSTELAAPTTQSVNGITVSVSNFRREADKAKIDVCFDMPDNSDWTLWHTSDTFLRYENGQVSRFGFEMIERTNATPSTLGKRCDILHFRIPFDADLSNVTLSIAAIGAEPREGETCTVYLDGVQRALDADQTGIQLACVQEEWGDQLVVASKPETMSLEEAENIAFDDQIFEQIFTIRGPWEFTLSTH